MTQMIDMEDAEQLIAEYGEWTECAAFRWVRDGDTVRLQIAKTLEEITAPAGEREQ